MRQVYFIFGLFFGFSTGQVAYAAPSAEQILKKADQIRNPQIDYTVKVKVSDERPNKKNRESQYSVMVKGRDKSLVETLAPKVDRGRLLLMNETNYWGYLPNVSKPLRISMQEKLTGEVANGDLSRANFSGDYTPTLKKTKVIKKQKFYILDLKAKRKGVTYGRVELWVKAKTFRPHFAEFFAISGRKLKTCKYTNYKKFGGAIRPTQLIMTDAVKKGFRSVLNYSDIEIKPIPDKFFTKSYMKRLSK